MAFAWSGIASAFLELVEVAEDALHLLGELVVALLLFDALNDWRTASRSAAFFGWDRDGAAASLRFSKETLRDLPSLLHRAQAVLQRKGHSQRQDFRYGQADIDAPRRSVERNPQKPDFLVQLCDTIPAAFVGFLAAPLEQPM
jgi:hypothetical protein